MADKAVAASSTPSTRCHNVPFTTSRRCQSLLDAVVSLRAEAVDWAVDFKRRWNCDRYRTVTHTSMTELDNDGLIPDTVRPTTQDTGWVKLAEEQRPQC